MIDLYDGLLTQAAKELGIDIKTYCNGWIVQLSYKNVHRGIYGYQFDINNSVAANIANDKCATSALLSARTIPNVYHELIDGYTRHSDGTWENKPISEAWPKKEVTDFMRTYGPEIVCKPVRGSIGIDVYKTNTVEEAVTRIEQLLKRYTIAAISPFVAADSELRIVICDNKPLLAYRKTIGKDWRFNLAHGSTAEYVATSQLPANVVQDAIAACKAISLQLAAVDFLETKEGYVVLEINSGFKLTRFAKTSSENKERAVNAYKYVLKTMFSIG